jgi:hypothetical protein
MPAPPQYEISQASFEKKLAQEKAERSKMDDEPKVETILGNDLTNSQKWAWVIGLTLAAWGLIYWSQKQANK